MQTQIDYLNIKFLSQVSLGTVGASAVFNGYLIFDDGTMSHVSLPITPTQQSWTTILGNATNLGIPIDSAAKTLVLKNVPAFFIGINGNINGSLSPGASYVQIASGTWRVGGKGTQAERIFKNTFDYPLEDTAQILIAGYNGSQVMPLNISGNGAISTVPAQLIKIIDYDANNNPIYIGQAVSGTAATSGINAWTIRKVLYNGAGNATNFLYASLGANNLDWTLRASYTYS